MFGEIQTELSQIHWALVKYTHRPRHLKAVSQPLAYLEYRMYECLLWDHAQQLFDQMPTTRSTQNRNNPFRHPDAFEEAGKDLGEYLRDLRGLAAASLADDDGGGVPLHQVEDGLAVLVHRQPLPLSL